MCVASPSSSWYDRCHQLADRATKGQGRTDQDGAINSAVNTRLKVQIEASIAALFEREESFRASVDRLVETLLHLG